MDFQGYRNLTKAVGIPCKTWKTIQCMESPPGVGWKSHQVFQIPGWKSNQTIQRYTIITLKNWCPTYVICYVNVTGSFSNSPNEILTPLASAPPKTPSVRVVVRSCSCSCWSCCYWRGPCAEGAGVLALVPMLHTHVRPQILLVMPLCWQSREDHDVIYMIFIQSIQTIQLSKWLE